METTVSKKHIAILATVIGLVILAFGFGIYTWISSLEANEKKDVSVQELKLSVTEYEFELGDTPPDFKRFIMKSDIRDGVEIDLSNLNQNEVGEYEIKYTYTDLNIPYGNILKVKIVDTTPPTIKLKNLVMEVDSEVDVMQFVEEYQDYQKVEFTFKDVPDMSKKGNQYIRILATDASGNETFQTVMLTLNEKINNSSGDDGGSVVEPTTPNTAQPPSPTQPQQPAPSQGKAGSFVEFPIEQHGTFDNAYSACRIERSSQINSGVTGVGSCRPYKVDGINKGYELVWE